MARNIVDPRQAKLSHLDLLQRREDAARSRRTWENDWYMNLSYLNNEQRAAFVQETGTLINLSDDGDLDTSQDSVHNMMLKIARIERAKILRTKPRPSALPANQDDDAYTTARILEAYFDQLMWEWDFPRRLRHAIYWLVATGNVFYKWYWDDGPQLDVVPPFEMYPDPYVREFEQSRWAIHSRFYDMETAWDMYGDIKGVRREHLSQSETKPLSTIEQKIYTDLTSTTDSKLNGINIHEYWEPPRGKKFQGRFIVFSESGIIYESEYPYEHKELPFTHVTHIVRSSTKWAASMMDYMRPLQDELNRAEAMNIENSVLMNGKWWLDGQLELEEEPDGSPRQVLRGTSNVPGIKPEFIQPNGYPAWAGERPDYYKQAMQDIAGQHEVSNGGTPGRVESGQAIQLLQESDDAVIRDAIDSNEEAIARGFWQSAALYKQYGDPVKLIQAYDENGAIEVRQMYKDKIDLATRIRVQTTTALPTSLAGKSDRVLNWLQYGVVTPEDARELLDLSSENPSLLPYLRDKLNAIQENVKMKSGDDVIPVLWDDHDVHLDQHYKEMKTEEFRNMEPQAQEAFIQHIDLHKELKKQVLSEEAEYQMIMQGAMQGQPEGGAQDTAPPAGAEPPPGAPAPPEGAGPQPSTMAQGG